MPNASNGPKYTNGNLLRFAPPGKPQCFGDLIDPLTPSPSTTQDVEAPRTIFGLVFAKCFPFLLPY